MGKKSSLFFGLFLVIIGILSLSGNLLLSVFERNNGLLQLWPVIVIGMGLLFCMPPLFFPHNRGLGGLFIPGLPVLATGGILYAASISGNWGLWGTLWPLEVISLGIGFVLAAIFIRVIWLLIPAFIIGLTGLALQFSAMTGMWAAWAVLWTVIPLGLGLAFIIIGLKEAHRTLAIVGAGFCGFAGVAFAATSIFSVSWKFINLLAPVFVIAMGIIIILIGFLKPAEKTITETPLEETPAE